LLSIGRPTNFGTLKFYHSQWKQD